MGVISILENLQNKFDVYYINGIFWIDTIYRR